MPLSPSSVGSIDLSAEGGKHKKAEEILNLHFYGRELRSIAQLRGLNFCCNLQELNLHMNCISRISHHLTSLTSLTSLNLSSNRIARIQGLEHVRQLTELDLSSNKLQVVEGLESLSRLKHLLLAHNKIHSLSGLNKTCFQRHSTVLTTLDLKDNSISSLSMLRELRGHTTLSQLTLHTSSTYSNPVCKDQRYKEEVLTIIGTSLVLLDGRRVKETGKMGRIKTRNEEDVEERGEKKRERGTGERGEDKYYSEDGDLFDAGDCWPAQRDSNEDDENEETEEKGSDTIQRTGFNNSDQQSHGGSPNHQIESDVIIVEGAIPLHDSDEGSVEFASAVEEEKEDGKEEEGVVGELDSTAEFIRGLGVVGQSEVEDKDDDVVTIMEERNNQVEKLAKSAGETGGALVCSPRSKERKMWEERAAAAKKLFAQQREEGRRRKRGEKDKKLSLIKEREARRRGGELRGGEPTRPQRQGQGQERGGVGGVGGALGDVRGGGRRHGVVAFTARTVPVLPFSSSNSVDNDDNEDTREKNWTKERASSRETKAVDAAESYIQEKGLQSGDTPQREAFVSTPLVDDATRRFLVRRQQQHGAKMGAVATELIRTQKMHLFRLQALERHASVAAQAIAVTAVAAATAVNRVEKEAKAKVDLEKKLEEDKQTVEKEKENERATSISCLVQEETEVIAQLHAQLLVLQTRVNEQEERAERATRDAIHAKQRADEIETREQDMERRRNEEADERNKREKEREVERERKRKAALTLKAKNVALEEELGKERTERKELSAAIFVLESKVETKLNRASTLAKMHKEGHAAAELALHMNAKSQNMEMKGLLKENAQMQGVCRGLQEKLVIAKEELQEERRKGERKKMDEHDTDEREKKSREEEEKRVTNQIVQLKQRVDEMELAMSIETKAKIKAQQNEKRLRIAVEELDRMLENHVERRGLNDREQNRVVEELSRAFQQKCIAAAEVDELLAAALQQEKRAHQMEISSRQATVEMGLLLEQAAVRVGELEKEVEGEREKVKKKEERAKQAEKVLLKWKEMVTEVSKDVETRRIELDKEILRREKAEADSKQLEQGLIALQNQLSSVNEARQVKEAVSEDLARTVEELQRRLKPLKHWELAQEDWEKRERELEDRLEDLTSRTESREKEREDREQQLRNALNRSEKGLAVCKNQLEVARNTLKDKEEAFQLARNIQEEEKRLTEESSRKKDASICFVEEQLDKLRQDCRKREEREEHRCKLLESKVEQAAVLFEQTKEENKRLVIEAGLERERAKERAKQQDLCVKIMQEQVENTEHEMRLLLTEMERKKKLALQLAQSL